MMNEIVGKEEMENANVKQEYAEKERKRKNRERQQRSRAKNSADAPIHPGENLTRQANRTIGLLTKAKTTPLNNRELNGLKTAATRKRQLIGESDAKNAARLKRVRERARERRAEEPAEEKRVRLDKNLLANKKREAAEPALRHSEE
jgi:hypothetical protein